MPNQVAPKSSESCKICFCFTLRYMISACRWFGLAPIKTLPHDHSAIEWVKEDAGCKYKASKLFRFYNYLEICVLVTMMAAVYFYDQEYKGKDENMTSVLNEWIYIVYSILMVYYCTKNSHKFVANLNEVSEFLKYGLICDKAKKSMTLRFWVGCALGISQMCIQIGVRVYLALKNDHEYKANAIFYLGLVYIQLYHNMPFLFSYLFTSTCQVYRQLFDCFEPCLKKVLVQQRNGEDEKHYHVSFLECANFLEMTDFSRRLHEKIRQSLLRFNEAFNPQIFIHLCIELLMIIMHLYAIITYYAVEHVESEDKEAENVLDFVFIVTHLIMLGLFLLAAQDIKNAQNGAIDLLNMYAAEHLTAEEYSQIRLFSVKMQALPTQIMAGRLFVVDIELLAPLVSSIVTYLLVALQFKWPERGSANQLA